jgi:diguanylate cyclase (GGDEF)-like protein
VAEGAAPAALAQAAALPAGAPATQAVELLREWLLAGWTGVGSEHAMVRETARVLANSELAVERLSLVSLPAYASHDGVQFVWERDQPDTVRTLLRPVGFLDDPQHLASPLHAVLTSGQRLRARVCAGEGTDRFAFLAELAASGCTDYLATPLPTRRPTVHVMSLATRVAGGWRDDALDARGGLLPVWGLLAEVWECQRLLETAGTDALTKVASRRAFEVALRQAWSTAVRTATPLSVVCFDIDHFKGFNDVHGHPEGDRCLARIASAAGACAQRGGDVLARLGGEEFALLLPVSSAEGARDVGERVRAAVEALAIPHPTAGTAPHVTVSVGTATLVPDRNDLRSRLFELADSALYRAKRQGRNRVESA